MSRIIPAQELYFAVGSEQPDLQEIVVFDALETTFLGETFVFEVIGSSHYIHSDDSRFYEICSCKGMEIETAQTLSLEGDTHKEFTYRGPELTSETTVSAYDLTQFPSERIFDLSYTFAEKALTAIEIADTKYETYHTYPERELTLYTKTTFERNDDC